MIERILLELASQYTKQTKKKKKKSKRIKEKILPEILPLLDYYQTITKSKHKKVVMDKALKKMLHTGIGLFALASDRFQENMDDILQDDQIVQKFKAKNKKKGKDATESFDLDQVEEKLQTLGQRIFGSVFSKKTKKIKNLKERVKRLEDELKKRAGGETCTKDTSKSSDSKKAAKKAAKKADKKAAAKAKKSAKKSASKSSVKVTVKKAKSREAGKVTDATKPTSTTKVKVIKVTGPSTTKASTTTKAAEKKTVKPVVKTVAKKTVVKSAVKPAVKTKITVKPASNKVAAKSTAKPAPKPKTAAEIAKEAKEKEILTRVKSRSKGINFTRIGKGVRTKGDDLRKIKGIGPFLDRKLRALGINTYVQISKLTDEDIEQIGKAVEFYAGRIRRDDWVSQAKKFVAAAE